MDKQCSSIKFECLQRSNSGYYYGLVGIDTCTKEIITFTFKDGHFYKGWKEGRNEEFLKFLTKNYVYLVSYTLEDDKKYIDSLRNLSSFTSFSFSTQEEKEVACVASTPILSDCNKNVHHYQQLYGYSFIYCRHCGHSIDVVPK